MIRKATDKDFDEVFELHKQLVEHLVKVRQKRYVLKKDERARFREKFDWSLENEKATVLVYEEKSKILGYVIGNVEKAESFLKYENYGYLDEVTVDEKHRRKEIGSKLVAALGDFFKRRGIGIIQGFVDTLNEVGLGAWKKNGFEIEYGVIVKDI